MIKKLKLVVFDLDGTLVDSQHSIIDGFSYALSPFDIHVNNETIESIRHKQPERVFEDLLSGSKEQEALKRLKHYFHNLLEPDPLFEGVGELLEGILAKGVPMAIWTGRGSISANKILNQNGIENYFQYLIGGTDLEENKPNPQGLLKVMEYFRVHPSETVMIGDHVHDLEAADSVEVMPLGCTWAQVFHEHLEKGPWKTFETPFVLRDYLNSVLA